MDWQCGKSGVVTESFIPIFCDFLLEVTSALRRASAPYVISVLNAFLYCILLPSRGDKLRKVICQDPWAPEAKMKGMNKDTPFFFQLHIL